MGNRELDAKVAIEVMGWNHRDCIATLEGDVFITNCNVPEYSESHDDVATVRAEIERRGLTSAFIDELWDLLCVDPSLYCNPSDYWVLLNATPEAQCLAAVKAAKP